MAVGALAGRFGCVWRDERRFPGRIAKASAAGVVWHLLLPTTYMNHSGQAVRGYLEYFQIPRSQLLVVVDDIALDFGDMRLKERGSSGGHNGLKSIEAHLATQFYKRLRMGIGDRSHGDLADYVLATFSAAERRQLPEFVDRAVEVMEQVPHHGVAQLMTGVNARKATGKSKQELESQE